MKTLIEAIHDYLNRSDGEYEIAIESSDTRTHTLYTLHHGGTITVTTPAGFDQNRLKVNYFNLLTNRYSVFRLTVEDDVPGDHDLLVVQSITSSGDSSLHLGPHPLEAFSIRLDNSTVKNITSLPQTSKHQSVTFYSSYADSLVLAATNDRYSHFDIGYSSVKNVVLTGINYVTNEPTALRIGDSVLHACHKQPLVCQGLIESRRILANSDINVQSSGKVGSYLLLSDRHAYGMSLGGSFDSLTRLYYQQLSDSLAHPLLYSVTDPQFTAGDEPDNRWTKGYAHKPISNYRWDLTHASRPRMAQDFTKDLHKRLEGLLESNAEIMDDTYPYAELFDALNQPIRALKEEGFFVDPDHS